jgi:4-amino-4-deoxy-L-arabinose transferase-like glycosyltransferase
MRLHPLSMQSLGALVRPVAREMPAFDERDLAEARAGLLTSVILAGILLLAFASRWAYLLQIPELTDETIEIRWALSISRGEQFPLTNYVAFTGPIFHYLLAAIFKLFGPSLLAARLLVMLLGCVTVLVTYALARTIAGRTVALLAAGFMATSSVHTLSSSHLAWSHSTTPFFVSLTLWQLARAVRHGSPRGLLIAAVLLGLAMQSHPSVFLLVPAVAAYLAWKGRHLLRPKVAAAMLGLLAISYSNMLVHNAVAGLESLEQARGKESDYARTLPETSRGYYGRALEVLSTLVRLPASQLGRLDSEKGQTVEPLTLAYAGFSLAGLALLAARGQPLPALGVAGLALLLPLSSAEHSLLPRQGRYLAPALPLMYIGLAAALVWALDKARHSSSRWAASAGLAILVLILLPVGRTLSYHRTELADGRTNQRYFDTLAFLRAEHLQGKIVLLDSKLMQERTGAGGQALRSLQTLAALEGVPVGVFGNDSKMDKQLKETVHEVVLLSSSPPDPLERRLVDSGVTAELVEEPVEQTPYRIYRLQRTGPQGSHQAGYS